ncbi:GMC oxidoreductase [Burkholderia cepacia]|uniref:GMC oxidoreductase n=1 Tax=Burkholderia cepacia TaxID=292 RepID=UPI0009C13242|nr:GMC family oxidoreductase [Burkholderia cepacia]
MQILKYQTVIIGSGFAGRTVADKLSKGSYLIVERGEDRDYGQMYARFEEKMRATGDFHAAEDYAYGSDFPWNVRPQLSRWNYSKYSMVRGGTSNWWGGNTRRCSPETFEQDGPVSWPISYDELTPWYEQAEQLLRVAGDPDNPIERPFTSMPGAQYWRDAYKPYFPLARLSNVALNRVPEGSAAGQCKGRSQCTICREDAKIRPDNVFREHDTLYGAFAMSILFDGDVAKAIECYDGKQIFQIEFDCLVVAANGVETPRLFGRSELPEGVRRESIGRFYQDHGHLDLHCKLDQPLAYGNLGGLAHVHVPEISTYYPSAFGPIEASAFALTHEPPPEAFEAGLNPAVLRARGSDAFMRDVAGCFAIFCELEIPPTAGFRVDLDSEEPRILDDDYVKVIEAFDDVTGQICRKLTALGIEVVGINPKYRAGYNSHHLSGTMNCSDGPNGVVDRDMRVIGTRNVYVAGSSVMPRAGGHGPTLTIVALAARLGEYLAASVQANQL